MKHRTSSTDFLCDDLFIYWQTCPTAELNAFWEQFLKENPLLEEPFREAVVTFRKIRNERTATVPDETTLKKLLQERIAKHERKKRHKLIFSSSAAAVVLLTIAITFFTVNRSQKDELPTADTSIGKVMEENTVQLISGNTVLEIDNNATVSLAGNGNSALVGSAASQKKIDLANSETNRLVVPFGKRSSVVLADGSKVDINSGTEIEFPTVFAAHAREIRVEGEIFIQVTQNAKPFIIRTPHSYITVHGTSFNVSSYSDENHESVVLVNGSVEVKSQTASITLKPNEMAEIENGSIQRKQVDVDEYISWKSGYMQLNKTPLEEVLKKIGRYYNVKFTYTNELDLHAQTCSGKLFLSENMNNVLDAFSKMTFLSYEKNDGNTIRIAH